MKIYGGPMFKRILLVMAALMLMGCAQLKAQFATRGEPWERDVFIKRYESYNGVPIGIASPEQDAYAITFAINQNNEWNMKNTVIIMAREELKYYATSFLASVFVHEFIHVIEPENSEEAKIVHEYPYECYSHGYMHYPEKFVEQPMRNMCKEEMAWLMKRNMGENRKVKLRKADAWMEAALTMAIDHFNQQVGKKVFVYAGLQ